MLFLSTAFSHKLGWKASCADFLQAEMVFAERPHCLIGSDCGHVAGVILKYTAGKVAGCFFPTGYRTKSRSRAREIASYARGVDCSIRSAPENCYGQTETHTLSLSYFAMATGVLQLPTTVRLLQRQQELLVAAAAAARTSTATTPNLHQHHDDAFGRSFRKQRYSSTGP